MTSEQAFEPGEGIKVRSISVVYPNGTKALVDASFSVPRGSITALVGVNGAGKSTLFKAIMGFVLLILGVALWWAAHLFKRVAPGPRAAMGDKAKGLFALLIVGSIVLMVLGYRSADGAVY